MKSMMIYDALKLHVYHVGRDMTGTKKDSDLTLFSTNESILEDFLVNKTLL